MQMHRVIYETTFTLFCRYHVYRLPTMLSRVYTALACQRECATSKKADATLDKAKLIMVLFYCNESKL